ncbi:hypothetical protein C8Q76DRAFT_733514 [Earliella scabrosa]|nr:hypothetical protein C8Q76DRAFT_733514 [Earliella scabrosa]
MWIVVCVGHGLLLSPLLSPSTHPYYRRSARTRLVCAYDIPPRSCLIPLQHRIAYLVSRPSRPHLHSHPHPQPPSACSSPNPQNRSYSLPLHPRRNTFRLSCPPNLRVPALGFRIVDTLVVHWNLYYSCPLSLSRSRFPPLSLRPDLVASPDCQNQIL